VNFTGKVALVTGASRGIGRAIAHRLAAGGATVAAHYRRDEGAARETVAALAGGGHFSLPADLSDPDAGRALVDAVVARAGRLDILVNNAGIYEELDVVAAQSMRRSGGGRIVNISSRGAFRGEPTAPAYAASKAGLNALGQSLALAFGPDGVTVATVAPGFVETDMTTEILAGPRGDAIRAQSPLGRVGTVHEVAAAVAYLASEDAVFATGAVLDLNGASYLRT